MQKYSVFFSWFFFFAATIVMNEKHNNRSSNSFRARHPSSVYFLFVPFSSRFWQTQYEILMGKDGLVKEKNECRLLKCEKEVKELLLLFIFCANSSICNYTSSSWHRESGHCIRFSTLLRSMNPIELQHSDTYDRMDVMFLSFFLSWFSTMNESQWRLNSCQTGSFINKIDIFKYSFWMYFFHGQFALQKISYHFSAFVLSFNINSITFNSLNIWKLLLFQLWMNYCNQLLRKWHQIDSVSTFSHNKKTDGRLRYREKNDGILLWHVKLVCCV